MDKKKILEKFQCQNCGACCLRDGYVYVNEEEIKKISQFLKMDTTKFIDEYVATDSGWNIISSPQYNPNCFLNNNQCKIYPVRPQYCRKYPNCPDVWMSKESLQEDAKSCPGLRAAIKT
jgi:uncharacterized protein